MCGIVYAHIRKLTKQSWGATETIRVQDGRRDAVALRNVKVKGVLDKIKRGVLPLSLEPVRIHSPKILLHPTHMHSSTVLVVLSIQELVKSLWPADDALKRCHVGTKTLVWREAARVTLEGYCKGTVM